MILHPKTIVSHETCGLSEQLAQNVGKNPAVLVVVDLDQV